MPDPIRCCLLVISLGFPLAVQAGPWAREPGQTFIAASIERDRSGDSYSSLYSEHGLSPHVTIGLELGSTSVGERNAMIWTQYAFDPGQGPHRFSIAAGSGVVQRNGETRPLAQIAAFYGRGFEGPFQGGWFGSEARLKFADDLPAVEQDDPLPDSALAYLMPRVTAKLDLTFGMHVTPAMMVINQLRLENRKDADFQAKYALTAVRDVHGPLKVEVGYVATLTGVADDAIKIGTWIEF